MANRTSQRTLTIQQVIDLVESIDVPVMRIEKDLGITSPILARALKLDTKKPLPVKFEQPLIEYVKRHRVLLKEEIQKAKEVLVDIGSELPEATSNLSQEEMDNKLFWLNAVKEARANHS